MEIAPVRRLESGLKRVAMLSLINLNNSRFKKQLGVTLLEMVVFIVIVSIALTALVGAYRRAMAVNVNPIIRVQALEAAQSRLDEILILKYDERTPTGGVPACNTTAAACNNITDNNMDDIDDFNGVVDNPYPGYTRTVTVVANNNIKLITVTVRTPANETILLAVERANF